MSNVSRRRFLANVTAATALTRGVMPLAASVPLFITNSLLDSATARGNESSGERVLVVVQLSGGNDGLNTVIPYRDDRYRHARPSLAQDASQLLKINDELALHSKLKGFERLLADRQLAIVQGVGYPNPNRSHFESMDIWHTADVSLKSRTTGWLGRSLEMQGSVGSEMRSPSALHFGSEPLPLALTTRHVVVPSVRSIEQFRLEAGSNSQARSRIAADAGAMRSVRSDLLQFVTHQTTAALDISARLESAQSDYSSGVKYPSSGLAEKLRQVAQLIDADLPARVYYVTLDGFDTHSDQAAAHAALLEQLGTSLSAFVEDLQQHGHFDRVATLIFSEFGRRVKENSSRGTDHGAAAPVFVLGSKIRSGLLGKHPDLGDLLDGDLKTHTDFRTVYASLLKDWLGWPLAGSLVENFEPYELLIS